MKITSLLENTASCELVTAEHGLSLYIETEHQSILFDMGQTALFAENASALGIDLSRVDLAVLSHGHYDHGGGLHTFLQCNDHAKVYVHKDAFLPHYNGTEKYIGLDPALRENERIVLVSGTYSIAPNLTLRDCNERPRPHNLGCFGLTERVGADFIPDDFRHEQYLLIEENEHRVLISGCSHKGIWDIAEWFRPDVLVGGFHVSKMPLSHPLDELAKGLDQLSASYYTCHCTGTEQYHYMKQFMKDLHYLSCGESITV